LSVFSATIEVVKNFSWKRNQNKHYSYKIRTKIPSISTHVDKNLGSRGFLFRKSTIYGYIYKIKIALYIWGVLLEILLQYDFIH
jgi:hypothetical protein